MPKLNHLLILGKEKIRQVFTSKKQQCKFESYARPEKSFDNSKEQYDRLTNLPNRSYFCEKLSSVITEAKNKKAQMALMFLDLDRFKKINDTLGHEAGDRVLQVFVKIIKSCLRRGDICGRWGGDEFAILLPNITGEEEVIQISRKIIELLKAPLKIFGYQLYLHSSIGIAMYPQDGETAKILKKRTDIALSGAKSKSGNNFQFYDVQLNKHTTKMLTVEHCLHDALNNQEFVLHYQPQLNLDTGGICGVEALLRWRNPLLGQVSPYEFISVAEEIGLIESIGEWVLENALAQNLAWQKAGLSTLRVSVNISPIQLKNPNFTTKLEAILNKAGLPPYLLDLEVTENCLMEDIKCIRDNLHQLVDMGVQISLDDFGTGYSSLSYLKHFPFHSLKIDQSFVHDLKYSPRDGALIETIVSIARSFNMRVVAEGAESIEQIKLLTSLGCDCIQGYWLSKPLPSEQIEKFIHNYYKTDEGKKTTAIINKYKNKPPLYLIA